MKSVVGQTLKQIGLANLLWNKLEVLWYLYFTVLMHGTGRPQVDAIYRSHDTGHKKRSLIASVADEVLKDDLSRLQAARKLIGRTNEAASTRNALIHADFHIRVDDEVANIGIAPGGDHSKKNRLAGQELTDELSTFVSTLKTLVEEVEALLPAPPSMPHGSAPLTTARWLSLLDEALASENSGGNEP